MTTRSKSRARRTILVGRLAHGDLTVCDDAGPSGDLLAASDDEPCVGKHVVHHRSRVHHAVAHDREHVGDAEYGELRANGSSEPCRLCDGAVAARAAIGGHEDFSSTPRPAPAGSVPMAGVT